MIYSFFQSMKKPTSPILMLCNAHIETRVEENDLMFSRVKSQIRSSQSQATEVSSQVVAQLSQI